MSAAAERDGSAPRAWQLSLLGPWRLRRAGVPVRVGPAGQRLLALLALNGWFERGRAAGVLWPDSPQPLANANLRATLSRLQKQGMGDLVRRQQRCLALDERVAVDVRALRATATAILHDRLPDPGWWTVCELEGDDLLPSWDEEWLGMERERLRQLRLHALEALSGQLLAADDAPAAVQAALAAVTVEPLRESAHRALIRAHLAEGNRNEALRQLARLRRLLHEELGVEPSAHAVALLRR